MPHFVANSARKNLSTCWMKVVHEMSFFFPSVGLRTHTPGVTTWTVEFSQARLVLRPTLSNFHLLTCGRFDEQKNDSIGAPGSLPTHGKVHWTRPPPCGHPPPPKKKHFPQAWELKTHLPSHHRESSSSSQNSPVGPLFGNRANFVGVRAPTSGGRVPLPLVKSVSQ